MKFRKQKVKNNGKGKNNNLWHVGPEELFDDCAICQATKAAMEEGRELSEKELHEAFKRSHEQGAVTGKSMADLEKALGIKWGTKLMLKIAPLFMFKRLAKKKGVGRVIFDKAHEVFGPTKRVDIIPLTDSRRGFILVLDRETALYFYQDGDGFKYDSYEMGKYNKGDVTIFDHLKN